MTPATMRANDKAWKMGYDVGRKERRRKLVGAGALFVVWRVMRDPAKHVMVKALAFYALLGLLVLAPVWVAAVAIWGAVKLVRRVHLPVRVPVLVDAGLDAVPF